MLVSTWRGTRRSSRSSVDANRRRYARLVPEATKPRVGRPPRISRALIAEAAHDIGLDEVTMRAVAERLGVGIASLYHHVDGRDDLLRLAAEHGAARARQPQD